MYNFSNTPKMPSVGSYCSENSHKGSWFFYFTLTERRGQLIAYKIKERSNCWWQRQPQVFVAPVESRTHLGSATTVLGFQLRKMAQPRLKLYEKVYLESCRSRGSELLKKWAQEKLQSKRRDLGKRETPERRVWGKSLLCSLFLPSQSGARPSILRAFKGGHF